MELTRGLTWPAFVGMTERLYLCSRILEMDPRLRGDDSGQSDQIFIIDTPEMRFDAKQRCHPREGGDPSLGLPLRDALPMFRVSGLLEKCQKKTGIAPGFFMSFNAFA